MQNIEPKEVAEKIEAGDKFVLLDVRELPEVNFCKIEDSVHIPMRQIPASLDQLDPEETYIVYCHTGRRSFEVGRFLESQGFKSVYNLAGGINQWSLQVDSSIPRY